MQKDRCVQLLSWWRQIWAV